MVDKLYAFTEEDNAIWQAMKREWFSRRATSTLKSSGHEPVIQKAPDVYIGLVKTGGISAFNGTTGGVGFGYVTVYFNVPSGTGSSGELVSAGFDVRVLNFGPALAAGTFVEIARDKAGSWYVMQGNASGGGGGTTLTVETVGAGTVITPVSLIELGTGLTLTNDGGAARIDAPSIGQIAFSTVANPGTVTTGGAALTCITAGSLSAGTWVFLAQVVVSAPNLTAAPITPAAVNGNIVFSIGTWGGTINPTIPLLQQWRMDTLSQNPGYGGTTATCILAAGSLSTANGQVKLNVSQTSGTTGAGNMTSTVSQATLLGFRVV